MKINSIGFTLIELLVVIAIIGILASVIISSLNDARESSVDAKIQLEMDSLADRAKVDEINSLTFDTVCGSNGYTQSTVIAGLVASINAIASTTALTVVCNSDNLNFAVSAPVTGGYWCVDNQGVSKKIATSLISGADFQCP